MTDNEQSKGGMTKVLISGAVLVAVGAGVYALTGSKDTTDTSDRVAVPETGTTETPNVIPPTPSPEPDAYVYADGKYTQDGKYISPGGPESIGITLTIEDDVIVDAEAEPQATLPASQQWQTTFANGLKSQVVGKKLDDVSLTKVSGSSLTPQGFNDAVIKIKQAAKI